jgi:hypothetical protein
MTMKILFINSPECDYMQDLLYSGLVKLFGSENVYDYPFNRRYHWVNRKYPRNLGFNPDISFLKRPFQTVNQKFDLVVVGSCKPLCFERYTDVIHQIPASVPVVFADGGDQPKIGGDLIYYKSPYQLSVTEKIRPFDLIFKREFFADENYEDRIIPLPFCMNMDRTPSAKIDNKKYQLSFWAVESHPIRVKALELIQDKFDCRENGTTRKQEFHKYKRKGKFYLEELSRCKVVLNFRGGGWDTMRYWETPAMQTFMISQKPGIMIPNDFVNGKHVVHCKDDLSDLVDLCEYYLKNEMERETIAKASHQHLLKYHTDIARAQSVIDSVKSRLKI